MTDEEKRRLHWNLSDAAWRFELPGDSSDGQYLEKYVIKLTIGITTYLGVGDDEDKAYDDLVQRENGLLLSRYSTALKDSLP